MAAPTKGSRAGAAEVFRDNGGLCRNRTIETRVDFLEVAIHPTLYIHTVSETCSARSTSLHEMS